MWDRKGAGSIGNPRRAVRLYFRPKPVSVKRRNRSERPERLLSERSEFQTRQRTTGNEERSSFSLELLVTFLSREKQQINQHLHK